MLNLAVDPLDSAARAVLAAGRRQLASSGNGVGIADADPSPWPSSYGGLDALRAQALQQPEDGDRTLRLGHLLFHLGRHAEGRALWQQAAELGAEPVIAYRALGMAAKTLEGDLPAARSWLEKANQADPRDSIVARDLARVLFDLADKTAADEKRALTVQASACLRGAFEEGQGRSDFVSLLARSYNRLGDHATTAKLLDSVRITIWEGAREAHDLFEEAHLALGDEHLKAGRPAEALAEFNRALEYPSNLATGRLENAREAHIQFRRGNALAALGRKEEAATAWRLAAQEPASEEPRLKEAREGATAALQSLQPLR
jgi:tetratricopeptide (TPR) repeat protein